MPESVLKSSLVYDADTTAKRIDGPGNGFCPRSVRRNFSNFEALGISEVAEVRLLVPGSEFSQKFDAGIVKKGSLNFSRSLGTVEGQEVMAG
jgi:hypothetical protein